MVVPGRSFILLKSVLESHSVYWMSLAIIPASVLNQIRKVMFSFLWNGCSNKFHFHLCKWESLAKPKIFGGWGFQKYPSLQQSPGGKYSLACFNEGGYLA
jgi:hypothetical protein